MHLSNQILGNINCNITSSALLLEKKSVIRVENIATCWDLNMDFKQTVWGLRPQSSERRLFRGHRRERGFLFWKEALLLASKDSLVSLGRFCLVFVPGMGNEAKAQRHPLKLVLTLTPLQVVVLQTQTCESLPAEIWRSKRPLSPQNLSNAQNDPFSLGQRQNQWKEKIISRKRWG